MGTPRNYANKETRITIPEHKFRSDETAIKIKRINNCIAHLERQRNELRLMQILFILMLSEAGGSVGLGITHGTHNKGILTLIILLAFLAVCSSVACTIIIGCGTADGLQDPILSELGITAHSLTNAIEQLKIKKRELDNTAFFMGKRDPHSSVYRFFKHEIFDASLLKPIMEFAGSVTLPSSEDHSVANIQNIKNVLQKSPDIHLTFHRLR